MAAVLSLTSNPLYVPLIETMSQSTALEMQSELQRSACMRKTAIKTIACCCCLLTSSCCCAVSCFAEVCKGESYEKNYVSECSNYEDEYRTLYCNNSTCECYPYWRAALPPTEKWNLMQLICNPFVCCIPCSYESTENYLLPDERKRLFIVVKIVQLMDQVKISMENQNKLTEISEIIVSYLDFLSDDFSIDYSEPFRRSRISRY